MIKPTELRYIKKTNTLSITFEDGYSSDITSEYLRCFSPSAEVKGHGPGQEKLPMYFSSTRHPIQACCLSFSLSLSKHVKKLASCQLSVYVFVNNFLHFFQELFLKLQDVE